MLNPEVLKCHEDLITLETYAQQGIQMNNKFFTCENINIFGYLGAGGGGGGSFNNQTGPYISSALWSLYRSCILRTFSRLKIGSVCARNAFLFISIIDFFWILNRCSICDNAPHASSSPYEVAHRKSHNVFICPNSHERLTKSEIIRSHSSRFEHCSESFI